MKQVFAIVGKLPQKGFSKTRLAKDLDEEKSLKLYEAFIKDFFKNLGKNLEKMPIYFFGTPASNETKEYFKNIAHTFDVEVSYFPQPEVSFFERLKVLFETVHAKEGECFIHLTGTDIPDFPFEKVQNRDLLSNVVTIGPDHDGGYYYLGTSSKNTSVFDLGEFMKDGDSGVFKATKTAAESNGLEVKSIVEWSDIDTLNDLKNCLDRSSKSTIPETYSICQELKL